MSKEDKKVLESESVGEALDEIINEAKKGIKALDDSTTIDERTANIFKDIFAGIKRIGQDIKQDVKEPIE